jgi:hypothetical protein
MSEPPAILDLAMRRVEQLGDRVGLERGSTCEAEVITLPVLQDGRILAVRLDA